MSCGNISKLYEFNPFYIKEHSDHLALESLFFAIAVLKFVLFKEAIIFCDLSSTTFVVR